MPQSKNRNSSASLQKLTGQKAGCGQDYFPAKILVTGEVSLDSTLVGLSLTVAVLILAIERSNAYA